MFTYNAELVKVVDGDTVDLKVDLGFSVFVEMRIRLYDVDTPEIRTKNLKEKELGMLAKNFVIESFAKNEYKCVVKTIKDSTDKYGRYLGIIYFGEENLNETLKEKHSK